uniref:NADH dehydrogenase [ubiquinone] 1 alpha subcomplex subunit 5 n=1 Tax=Schistocephalus solidus TaxID=70667 RepID=A0A0X3P4E6_SCHSO
MQALKKTTNLTGLAVAKAPHKSLKAIYSRILAVLQTMPSTASYRTHTEKLVTERLKMVETTPNISDLETKIDCGQIEEVIVQANREYELAKNMLKWKPWEPLVSEPPANQWKWPI